MFLLTGPIYVIEAAIARFVSGDPVVDDTDATDESNTAEESLTDL